MSSSPQPAINMGEPSEQEAMNYFDRLPDEMLTKIFREFLDKLEDDDNFWNLRLDSTTSEIVQSPSIGFSWAHDVITNISSIKVIRNFRGRTADETLRNLCMTSKRFNQIINGKSFTTPDTNQWPVLKLDARNFLRDHDCLHAYQFVKNPANSKFMRYKKLELILFNHDFDLECITNAIVNERSNLSSVLELKLDACVITPINLELILAALPNIKRLSIRDPSFKRGNFERISTAFTGQLTGRVLSSLNLNLGSYPDGHFLVDYILDYLPAREVRIQFYQSRQAVYGRFRRYLLKNKDIIKKFHFSFQKGETQVRLDEAISSLFEGFDYHVEEANHEYSVILSSGRRSRLEANPATVKYKRMEFFRGDLLRIYEHIYKAIENNRDCLSEVVELNLHRCDMHPRELSRILAVIPKIECLNICQEKGNLKMTYLFRRESESEEQPENQEAADPVASSLQPSDFDGKLSKDVHEHILAIFPNVRVLFKQKNGCECSPGYSCLDFEGHASHCHSWYPSSRTSSRRYQVTDFFCNRLPVASQS